MPCWFATPATVETTPAAVILRIVSLPVSATYRLPAGSAAMPNGALNCAAAPLPSARPITPAVPASGVTTPAAVILRMVGVDVDRKSGVSGGSVELGRRPIIYKRAPPPA